MNCHYDCNDRTCIFMEIDIIKYPLKFKFHAVTSRGSMQSKDSYFIRLSQEGDRSMFGIGECAPLAGLSPDKESALKDVFLHCSEALFGLETIGVEQLKKLLPGNYPAVLFALETALMDLMNGGKRIIYNNQFMNGGISIPINGLVWMGDKSEMKSGIDAVLKSGYDCIKLKIGGIRLEDELDLLKYIRQDYPEEQLQIRLDANGAFDFDAVFSVLERFHKYKIHSIEQPIKAGDWQKMHEVCKNTPIPVALDEELVGVYEVEYKATLLDEINPQYIVIKPTLTGGLRETEEWIQLAAKRAIGWWITSALESNIGLNAIAQFTANHKPDFQQGLGTGQLFTNNIPSPLIMEQGKLKYNKNEHWDLSALKF